MGAWSSRSICFRDFFQHSTKGKHTLPETSTWKDGGPQGEAGSSSNHQFSRVGFREGNAPGSQPPNRWHGRSQSFREKWLDRIPESVWFKNQGCIGWSFSLIFISFLLHPRKLTWNPKTGGLSKGVFLVPCWFSGVHIFCHHAIAVLQLGLLL